jgi:hypothetical protein
MTSWIDGLTHSRRRGLPRQKGHAGQNQGPVAPAPASSHTRTPIPCHDVRRASTAPSGRSSAKALREPETSSSWSPSSAGAHTETESSPSLRRAPLAASADRSGGPAPSRMHSVHSSPPRDAPRRAPRAAGLQLVGKIGRHPAAFDALQPVPKCTP